MKTSIIVRVGTKNIAYILSQIMTKINDCGAEIGAIDIVRADTEYIVRDITLSIDDGQKIQQIRQAIDNLEGVKFYHASDRTFLMHLGGKLEICPKVPLKNREDLSMAYTPGVAQVCLSIAEDVEKAKNLTIKKNTVAIISDGTAVLGLGDIGPEAAMPVMEGKAMLFKSFANVDAFPICLATKDTEQIIQIVKALAPTFGGINLEDISAPRCFEIEKRLKEELDIPVFHDDQHGTAIVVAAALINALKIVKKKLQQIRVVVSGVGAAGTAYTEILLQIGVKNIIGFDRQGALYSGRDNMNESKKKYAKETNPQKEEGTLKELIRGADVFIGVSVPNVIDANDVKKMNKDAIVFALSNPTPEVLPEEILPYVRIMATGRSDYPNQINNVLCFPGIFRGLLDAKASQICKNMMLAVAFAIADVITAESLCESYIIPSVFDKKVARDVANAVKKVALEEARKSN